MTYQLDLDAIEQRAKAATPGPWGVEHGIRCAALDRTDYDTVTAPLPPFVFGEGVARAHRNTDTEFIAHAREDVPALVAEVRRLHVEVERLRTERDCCVCCGVDLIPQPVLCEECAPTFEEYTGGSWCENHPPEAP